MIAGNIQPVELVNLHNIGFKLIPLDENNREVEAWTPIYNNPDYWTPENLVQQSYKFKNVATVFGKTHLKDEEGRDLYLDCLDIDSDNIYNILFNLQNSNTKQEYSLIPKLQKVTFVTKTKKKNGFHIYWLSHKQNKSITTEDCKVGFEFEIKTDKSRGHCTLPPSKHRDDLKFHYTNYGQNKIMISDELYDELMPLLTDYLNDKSERKDSNNNFGSKDDGEIHLSEVEIQNISDCIYPYYKKGCNCRNGIIYGITGFCRKYNVAKGSTIKLVETLAKDDEEKRGRMTVLEQSYKKAPREVSGIRKFLEVLEHATGNAYIAREIFQQIFDVIQCKLHGSESDEKIDYVTMLTDQIMKEYIFKTMKDSEDIYYYDNDKGLYVNGGEWLIREHLEILFPRIRTSQVIEVINHIKRRTGVDRSRFDSDPNILNLLNGFLNLATGEFTEHSPDQLSLMQLPISYNPKARCLHILKFLGEVLQPKDVFVALQIFGYCIYKTAKYEKGIMLFGGGDNGKGTFIRIIEELVGLDNTSHVSLQDLGRDQFAGADLYGKLVNTCADISAEKISNLGAFKMLVSGDSIRAQRKYEQPFSFRNYAKLVFSTNKIPETDDRTFAFYKRWIILNFEKVFRENKDTNLKDKLTRPEELSGLLNLALIGLKQLQKDNGFNVSIKDTVKQYNKSTDTTTTFLEEKCIVDLFNPDDYTLTTVLYNEYLAHCKEKNARPLEPNVFGTKLKKHGIERERIRNDGTREYCYLGIKLKSDFKGGEKSGASLLVNKIIL